jgi:hypothetical protein
MRDHGSDIDDELRVVAEEEDVLVGALERAEEVLRHIESDLAQVEEQKSAIDQEIEAETEDVQQVKRAELERRTVLEFERDDLIQKVSFGFPCDVCLNSTAPSKGVGTRSMRSTDISGRFSNC